MNESFAFICSRHCFSSCGVCVCVLPLELALAYTNGLTDVKKLAENLERLVSDFVLSFLLGFIWMFLPLDQLQAKLIKILC